MEPVRPVVPSYCSPLKELLLGLEDSIVLHPQKMHVWAFLDPIKNNPEKFVNLFFVISIVKLNYLQIVFHFRVLVEDKLNVLEVLFN